MKFTMTITADVTPEEIVTIMKEQFRQQQERDKDHERKMNRSMRRTKISVTPSEFKK